MRRIGVAAVALVLLAACKSDNKTAATTSSVATTPPTTAGPQYPPTDLTINGFSPGVNQAPFYPQAKVTAVTCAVNGTAHSVTLTIPAGGPGTAAGSAMTAPTTVVVTLGKAEARDAAGRVLYREASNTLVPTDHGSIVLAMTNVAGSDTSGRRVAAGSLNVIGDYLCP